MKNICFSEFCNKCSLNLKFGCEICYECKNLNFIKGIILECSEFIKNCKSCFFKFNSNYLDLQCLSCSENYFYNKEKDRCEILNKIGFKKLKILLDVKENLFIFSCIEGYFYDEKTKKCFPIKYNCNFGCLKCWGKNKNCLKCGEFFKYKNYQCIYKKKKTKINEESNLIKEIVKKFYSDENFCIKNINNITITLENNITTYLDQYHFINEKNFEIKEFYLDCSKNKLKCENYNKLEYPKIELKKINKKCDKNFEHNFNYKIEKIMNITIFDNIINFTKKNINIKREEKLFCENEKNCLNFKNFKRIRNITNILKYNKNYKISKNKILVFKNFLKKEKWEFCQKKLNYFCEWEKNCKKECEFILEKGNSGYIFLKNKNKKEKIFLSLNILKKKVPDFISVNYDYKNQKIIFKFLKNTKKNFIFKIEPILIENAKNCKISQTIEIKIENNIYSKILNFIENGNMNIILKSIIYIFLGFGSYFILSKSFYEFIQFFKLFTYYSFLEINGGSIYNFVINSIKNFFDYDFFFIKKKNYFEYLFYLQNLKNLLFISIFDFYLILSILIIFGFKIFLDKTFFYRQKKSKELYEKLKIREKNYYSYNLIKKIKFKIQKKYSKFHFSNILEFYKKVVFTNNIFNLPIYIYILITKINFIKKYFLFIFLFLYFIISFFLTKFFLEYFFYLKKKCLKFYKKIILKNIEEEIWYLEFYEFFFTFFNMINIFFIIIFKSQLLLLFILTSFSLIFQISAFIIFSKKNLFFYLFFEILSIFLFLIWIIFVALENLSEMDFSFYLNFFYVGANFIKIISKIVLIFILKKIKKNQKEASKTKISKNS